MRDKGSPAYQARVKRTKQNRRKDGGENKKSGLESVNVTEATVKRTNSTNVLNRSRQLVAVTLLPRAWTGKWTAAMPLPGGRMGGGSCEPSHCVKHDGCKRLTPLQSRKCNLCAGRATVAVLSYWTTEECCPRLIS